jgi:uncharacterized LabA/DUF88 family protein
MAYVDGFNLYFGLISYGWQRFLWLDPALLVEKLLKLEQVCTGVRYFTARLSGSGMKSRQQKVFLEATESLGKCSLHFGQYQGALRRCTSCGVEDLIQSEKMTDVNIAVRLLSDAHHDLYDAAILISGDGDLSPAVREIKETFGKRVVVAFPPGRFSKLLSEVASAHLVIGRAKLAASQLPNRVHKSDGSILERPQEWGQASPATRQPR